MSPRLVVLGALIAACAVTGAFALAGRGSYSEPFAWAVAFYIAQSVPRRVWRW